MAPPVDHAAHLGVSHVGGFNTYVPDLAGALFGFSDVPSNVSRDPAAHFASEWTSLNPYAFPVAFPDARTFWDASYGSSSDPIDTPGLLSVVPDGSVPPRYSFDLVRTPGTSPQRPI